MSVWEDLGEEGDDGALHDFWALSKEEIESLAALDEHDRMHLYRMARRAQ